MESTLSIEQIRANVERALREQAERYAAAPEPRKGARGRPLSATTRAKIAKRRFDQTRRLTLAAGNASKLTRARLEAGMSQRDLGKRAEVSVRSIQRAEVDPSTVSPKTLARLAQALEAPPAAII